VIEKEDLMIVNQTKLKNAHESGHFTLTNINQYWDDMAQGLIF